MMAKPEMVQWMLTLIRLLLLALSLLLTMLNSDMRMLRLLPLRPVANKKNK